MPLRDHFHPPLSAGRHWHAFHNAWATFISSDLNRRLPEGYFAEPNVQFGIEIDVATFEESTGVAAADALPSNSAAASPASWTPPAPVQTIPFPLVTDNVEVLIYGTEEGPILAGAIELVSPANKDRAEHREAFVAKCETYLQQRIGLVLVNVVTRRTQNLHDQLLSRFVTPASQHPAAELYAGAYRAVDRDHQASLDIWYEALAVGEPLATLPLWLRGGLCIPVELDATYERTCQEQRI